MKVGVLVVAYNAESTLVDVLDRIPQSASLQLAEVLVRDDHSTDETHSVASAYLQRESHLNLTVIRHEENLGYGGNQKAGYLYALDHGWDVVVLLHGDGQYAPEIMADMIAPIVARRRRRRVRLAHDGAAPAPCGAACRSTSTSATAS